MVLFRMMLRHCFQVTSFQITVRSQVDWTKVETNRRERGEACERSYVYVSQEIRVLMRCNPTLGIFLRAAGVI